MTVDNTQNNLAGGATLVGGTLEFDGLAAKLKLNGGVSFWTETKIVSDPDQPPGAIYVYGGANLNIVRAASYLDARLFIGVDGTEAENESPGTVNFGGAGRSLLAGNVTVYKSADTITIWPKGIINFNQNQNSDTTGGIVDATGVQSEILNYGTINRNVVDQDNKTLQIGVYVVSPATSGVLNIGTGSSIDFTGSYTEGIAAPHTLQGYNLKAGKVNSGGGGAHFNGIIGNGGKMGLLDPGTPGISTTTIDGALVWNAGIIDYEETTPGANNQLVVSGSLTMSGGSVSIPIGNALTVGGEVDQSGGTVDANGGTVTVAGAYNETGGAITLESGTVSANGGYHIGAGASLAGTGTLTADVTNSGTIQVGGASGIGVLTTAAGSSSGNLIETGTAALDFAIASASSYDTFSVAGQTQLAGALSVQLLGDFTPTVGDWFELMPNMTSGQFAALNVPTVNGVTFMPEYNAPGEGGFSRLAVPANTTTTLSSSSGYYNPTSTVGQPATLTATVTGA